MARRTGRNKYKTAQTPAAGMTVPARVGPQMFLPDFPDQVKAIAMRGLTDDEMAAVFGISEGLMESWKAYYPIFAKAIEDGRTQADAEVVMALHKNCVGFDYDTDEVIKTRHGGHIVTVRKRVNPDTNAIKFWLENRQPEKWGRKMHMTLGSKPGQPMALAVKAETKTEIINSILNMIQPRADGEDQAV